MARRVVGGSLPERHDSLGYRYARDTVTAMHNGETRVVSSRTTIEVSLALHGSGAPR